MSLEVVWLSTTNAAASSASIAIVTCVSDTDSFLLAFLSLDLLGDLGALERPIHGSRTVAVARQAMPSPRPAKPSRSVVVALTRDAADVEARDSATRARIASRWGPIFGRFADERRIEMDDRAASRAHPLRRMGEEDLRRRALPLRVGGREMRADVALGQRAIERVGERMQRDVGVGMSA